MNILDKITLHKKREVATKKGAIPLNLLEASLLFDRKCVSLASAIAASPTGIIAEFKRRSPSKSVINNQNTVSEVVLGYATAGASAVSVLTDTAFFGGALTDLLQARQEVTLPILRKDFIVDSYQIYEAKAYGADAILLIAASLSTDDIIEFSSIAKRLGMDVLIEIHNAEEIAKACIDTIDLIGVNNRNLKSFAVSTEISKQLADQIPDQFVKISESGISSIGAIDELRPYGYKGFLIGENFMKTENPGEAAAKFIQQLL